MSGMRSVVVALFVLQRCAHNTAERMQSVAADDNALTVVHPSLNRLIVANGYYSPNIATVLNTLYTVYPVQKVRSYRWYIVCAMLLCSTQ
jgi:dipeptide/tripeptide permease